jgi:MGT family glycosyltransferase
MSKKHIAFFNVPTRPHINPTLSIVSTLAKRGHRVSYVTSDRFEHTISTLGAECIMCQRLPTVADIKNDPRWKNWKFDRWYTWDDVGRGDCSFIEFSERELPQLSERLEHDRPDLILYDRLFPAGRVLAEQWKIPAVQTSPELAFHDVFFTRKNGVCYTPQGYAEFGDKLDAFFNAHGIPAKNSLFHKEKLHIHFFPRAFQFASESFDNRFLFAGGCIAARPSESEWKRKSTNGKPLILVSASTTSYSEPGYFHTVIEALKDLPWGVVIATGDMDDFSSFEDTPANVEIHQFLPYPSVLPHVWLNICRGGTSTVVESMSHGVALICISNFAELAENGDRVAELGSGIHIRQPELTAESLRRAVLRMAEDAAMLDRVKQMQQIIRSERVGPEEVANRIEILLTPADGSLRVEV